MVSDIWVWIWAVLVEAMDVGEGRSLADYVNVEEVVLRVQELEFTGISLLWFQAVRVQISLNSNSGFSMNVLKLVQIHSDFVAAYFRK